MGVAVGEVAQEEGVDHGEDGGVAADAEGEGEESEGGEAGIAAEGAEGIADVGPPAAGKSAAALERRGGRTIGGFDLAGEFLRVGELRFGAGRGFRLAESGGDGVLVGLFHLLGEFGDDFGLALGPHAQAAEALAEVGVPITHGRTP